MAARPGRQPGAMQRSARSPGRSPSPRKELEPSLEREQLLQKQLNELQKYKELEEKEKKKEEALKKKELTAAKKRITKEVQSSMKSVKKHEQEVMKLQTTIKKLQGQETDVKKKTAETENKFREKLQVTEVKHQDLESKLSQKYADCAQERVKLQQLQLQLDTLSGNNVNLSKSGALTSSSGMGALGDSGRGLPALHDSAVETTDAEGEERYAMAESEAARLAQQLEEAEDQNRTLQERLAQMEQGEAAGGNTEDLHRECREAIESLRRELERVREENEGLHAKLGEANKALELQEECIEELAGRASGVGEGLMNIASQELARCSVLQSESRVVSNACSRHESVDASGGEEGAGWRRLAEDEAVSVGDFVRLNTDSKSVREAFRNVGFAWNQLTDGMLGQSFQILEVPKQGIVGLPSPDGSQGGVWYFPITALQKATSQPPTPGSASATASTSATYQRASYTKGAASAHSVGMQARSSTPGRQPGFHGGGSGRPGLTTSGSSSSLTAAGYPNQAQTPASPPSFGGLAAGGAAAPEVADERRAAAARAAPSVWLQECTQQPASPSLGGSAPSASMAASTQVFVGAVPSDLSDDRLMTEFAKYGVIVDMQVQRDDSGPQKSYAFLTYQTQEEASRAVEAGAGGKLFLPGAATASEVGFARGAQVAGAGWQPAAPQPAPSSQQAQVMVRCIPNETLDEALLAEFGKYGAIVNMQLQRDPTGPEKSCAVVTFQSREDAMRAAEATSGGRLLLPGAVMPCEVAFVRSSPGQTGVVRQQPFMTAGQQVIVYSVPSETPDDLLMAEFAKFGTVVDFKMQRDPSGPHKSYAIVTYQTSQEAARAIEVTNGRLMMPGATSPAQVGFVPSSQPGVGGQLFTARQKQGFVGQQVLVCSIPTETSEEVLKAEFAKYGAVMDVQIQRDASGPQKSYAFVTYQTREEAARAVEATSGGLLLPGASAPCEVGFAARSTQSATGQVLTPGQLLSLRQQQQQQQPQQVRPQSAPRMRSGPGLPSGGASGVGVVAVAADVRRQFSGAEAAVDPEGACAWASPDPRRYIAQGTNRLDVSVASIQELDASRGRFGQMASAGALHSARPVMMARPWATGMPSEPIATGMPGGAEIRQLSPPCQRQMAGAVGSSPLLAPPPGSHVAQGGRVVAFRSPGPARHGVVPAAGVPGSASPGVLLVPPAGAAWRGGPVPANAWASAPRQPAPVTSGPPSAKGSYIPPVSQAAVQAAQAAGGVAMPTALSPTATAAGVAAPAEQDLSASVGRGVGFRDAVSKVTAKALREFRQNHRVSLSME